LWSLGSEHRQERRVLITVVSHAAPNACGDPNQIARSELAFDFTGAIRPDAGQLTFEDKEQFLDIGMQMYRPFIPGGKNHRTQRKVTGFNDVWIIVLARTAATHVTHLRTLVFGIHLRLKIQDVPIRAPVVQSRNVSINLIYVWN
jgi:hypothetical protein